MAKRSLLGKAHLKDFSYLLEILSMAKSCQIQVSEGIYEISLHPTHSNIDKKCCCDEEKQHPLPLKCLFGLAEKNLKLLLP